MPQLIRTLNQIAEQRGEGVLFVTFHKKDGDFTSWSRAARRKVIARLKVGGFGFEHCAPPPSSGFVEGHLGWIALQTRYCPGEPEYETLRLIFESDDGEPLENAVTLYFWDPTSQVLQDERARAETHFIDEEGREVENPLWLWRGQAPTKQGDHG